MAETRKFLAFSCVHCPLEDHQAVTWLLGQIEKEKPDVVVHLGDGHEADSASRWPTESDWDLKEEFQAHNDFLAKVRKAAPKADRVFMWGNHDDNLLSINRIDKRLRGLCDPRDHEPELHHWKHTPYVYKRGQGTFQLGQVTFAHGYEANASADDYQACLLCNPFGLYVGGHTHRPQHVQRCYRTKQVPLPFWYANAGCITQMDREYMLRKRQHQWGQACVVGEAQILKSPRMSKCWDAETRIFRMYDDEV